MEPLQRILEERKRQDNKWGVQNHENGYWYYILGEECGEVAKALLECSPGMSREDGGKELRKELSHVAAVALAWLECLERRGSFGKENS